jgi:hypothetical protein
MSRSHGDPGSWITISPDLSKNDRERIEQSKLTNLQYATIYTFAESPVKPGVYWAGTDDGNLQVSTDGGNSWQNITARFYAADGTPIKGVQGDRIPYDRWVKRVTPSAHDLDTCYVAYSGYRTHNEDTTYLFVTEDMGRTWRDIGREMLNPVNDIVEDPDNADVLYLATDYGLFVSIDRGENWIEMSETAPDVLIMDLDIQKRERDLAIGTYGRGIYIADIFPFKEFCKNIFDKESHLFDLQRTVKWNRLERRGPSYGEFAKANNPATGAHIYYFLKEKADSVKLVIEDLEGNQIQELRGKKESGIHKTLWNLRKRTQGEQGQRRAAAVAEAGQYKVTLVVNDKEVVTKRLEVVDDRLY